MVRLTPLETTQLNLLKKEIFGLPSGVSAYPRDLLSRHNQVPVARMVRRLVEEIDAGIETRIKKDIPKQDEWKFYWV